MLPLLSLFSWGSTLPEQGHLFCFETGSPCVAHASLELTDDQAHLELKSACLCFPGCSTTSGNTLFLLHKPMCPFCAGSGSSWQVASADEFPSFQFPDNRSSLCSILAMRCRPRVASVFTSLSTLCSISKQQRFTSKQHVCSPSLHSQILKDKHYFKRKEKNSFEYLKTAHLRLPEG